MVSAESESTPPDERGVVTLVFPAHGVRHIDGAARVIERLHPGDLLTLRDDRENEYNEHAILVVHDDPVGWVPDFLLGVVDPQHMSTAPFNCRWKAANGPDVPYNLRLLRRLQVEGRRTTGIAGDHPYRSQMAGGRATDVTSHAPTEASPSTE